MNKQKSNETTYSKKSEVIGLIKSSAHTTRKLTGEIKSLDEESLGFNSRNRITTKHATVTEKMIKDYQKRISNESIKRGINDMMKYTKLVDEVAKQKQEEARKANKGRKSQVVSPNRLSIERNENQNTSKTTHRMIGKKVEELNRNSSVKGK